MCDKATLEDDGTLQSVSDYCQNQEMWSNRLIITLIH